MSFLESPVFPEEISYGSQGGPGYSTTVVRMRSGHEQRIVNWSQARHVYDAAYAIQDTPTMQALISFFHIAEGKANGFRYRDPLDFNNVNNYYADNWMYMGDTDGVSSGPYQIKKYYYPGTVTTTATRIRDIKKPRNDGAWQMGQGGSGNVAGGGPSTTAPTFTVDYVNGTITWTVNPGVTAMWWKGNFDVPCRFDTDELPITIEAYEANTAAVPIIELRL